MIRTLAFASSIVALIVVAAYVGRQWRPVACINSSVVERLDVVSKNLAKSLHRCGDEWNVTKITPIERRWLQKIDRETHDIQKLLSMAGIPAPNGIGVRVHVDRPHLWSVTAQRLDLGVDVFEAPGQLIKALIISSFLRGSHGHGSPLTYEILADHLLIISQGEVDIVDPISARSTSAPWSIDWQMARAFQLESTICESPWKMGRTFNSCGLVSDRIALDSVRAFVSLQSTKLASELSLTQKRQLLRKFSKLVRTIDSPPHKELNSVEDVVELSNQYLSLLWDRRIEVSDILGRIKYIVETAEKRSDLLDEFEFEGGAAAVALNGEKVQFYSGGPFVRVRSKLPMPEKRIRVVKNLSKVGVIAELESKDERVLEVFSNGEGLKLKAYFENGPKAFLSNNPDSKFVVYHIPSVRLALNFGLSPDAVLKKGTSKLAEKMSRLLGLSQSESETHYNQAPISALEWHHF